MAKYHEAYAILVLLFLGRGTKFKFDSVPFWPKLPHVNPGSNYNSTVHDVIHYHHCTCSVLFINNPLRSTVKHVGLMCDDSPCGHHCHYCCVPLLSDCVLDILVHDGRLCMCTVHPCMVWGQNDSRRDTLEVDTLDSLEWKQDDKQNPNKCGTEVHRNDRNACYNTKTVTNAASTGTLGLLKSGVQSSRPISVYFEWPVLNKYCLMILHLFLCDFAHTHLSRVQYLCLVHCCHASLL